MAVAGLILALIASLLAVIGVLAANLGLVAPMTGFTLFAAGALLGGLLSVIACLLGVFLSRGGRDPEGRTRSLTGLAIGLGLLIVVLGAGAAGRGAPPINDITTDLENPPAFASDLVVPEYRGRDMSYPMEFVPIVEAAYPDLEPLRLEVPPDQAFDRAIAAAESLGWKIVARSDGEGLFDAQDESALFRFVDDIAVRVTADDGGSRIDVRSKSRDGRGDLGANAARIRAFFEEIR